MNKPILLALGIIVFLMIATIVIVIIISFKVVRQTTDKINLSLKSQMQQIVRIPDIIPPETKSFNSTTYIWEMETNQGEITKVKFSTDTAFDKTSDDFTATLQMEAGQDPSLFNKVLPAVIADKQAIVSIVDPLRVNLGKNDQIGYLQISLTEAEGRTGQVSKVTWTFPKDKIVEGNATLYRKLYVFPLHVLKVLYGLQELIIALFSGS